LFFFTVLADMQAKDTVTFLATASDSKFDAADRDTSDSVTVGSDTSLPVSSDTVGEHIDPSRLPPAQRQLYMRIQQKHKPISDITAKRACRFGSNIISPTHLLCSSMHSGLYVLLLFLILKTISVVLHTPT